VDVSSAAAAGAESGARRGRAAGDGDGQHRITTGDDAKRADSNEAREWAPLRAWRASAG